MQQVLVVCYLINCCAWSKNVRNDTMTNTHVLLIITDLFVIVTTRAYSHSE